ncbi:MAG: metallophosphoesterase [Promethearchaeota archaeon]|jgi:UDP-2,3-diacylglucosamine pyrophosphatase LpxH
MDEIKPKILVVSDVHLGSFNIEEDLFIQFLNRIINGEFGNELQALIILGDFVDLCTDLPRTILGSKKVKEIFTLLLEIKKKMNLVFLLGNHEIPVTGNYDNKFEHRKKKFLDKFSNSTFKELFDHELYYQYIILKKWNNKDMLLFYNSREQIENNPIGEVEIKGIDLDPNYNCFMVHGHQFESELYRFFVGQLWKSLIKSDKYEVKETYDYFWNQIIKNGRKIKGISFEQMKEELAQLKEKSIEEMDSDFSELSNTEFKFYKTQMRVMKGYQRETKLSHFLDDIKDFLEDERYDMAKINKVIFGHFHYKAQTFTTINRQQVEVINDGTWQFMPPSYLEICNNGRVYLKSIPYNR